MGQSLVFGPRQVNLTVKQKFLELNWLMVLVIVTIAVTGLALLYSVAGGSTEPWASRQALRFLVIFPVMLVVALVNIRFWMALAYPAYAFCLAALVGVEVLGVIGMGGQRWLDLGFMRLQPSELMKIALVLALARYYHSLSINQVRRLKTLWIPLLLIVIPAALVIRQPDLGTAMMIFAGGIAVIFLSGARLWIFVSGLVSAIAAIPIVWTFLRDYQQNRVLTFLNPERDPQGAGYQILQAKIATGSGGVSGKGFLQGTQSHLNFLPETKTDFIFTVLTEEFGITGGMILLGMYLILIGYGLLVSLGCRHQFGRLLASGLSVAIFFYVFINIAMVMGLVPVVGVPLPMVSYGGSAMLTMMIAYGLILSVALHRGMTIARRNPFG